MRAAFREQYQIMRRTYEKLLVPSRALKGGLCAFVKYEECGIDVIGQLLAAIVVVFKYLKNNLIGYSLVQKGSYGSSVLYQHTVIHSIISFC